MLARKFRLQGTYYIKRAREKGKIYQFPDFGMAVFERKEDGKPSRFAFTISIKIAKHAVDRNRIKRMLSEAVRFESTYLVPGFDVVFLTKKSIARRPTDEVMKQTKEALKKAKLVN